MDGRSGPDEAFEAVAESTPLTAFPTSGGGPISLSLERIRDLLLSPSLEHMQEATEGLSQAVEAMSGCVSRGMRDRGEMERIRELSKQIGLLLHQAGSYEMRWAGILSMTAAEYRADGREAPLAGCGKLVAEG